KFIEGDSLIELYQELFDVGINDWNWGFEDRYPEFQFIQGSAPELIEQIMIWQKPTINPVELFEEVFGKLEASDPESSDFIFDPVRCLGVRFFQRFCVPFGLLKDISGSGFNWQVDDPFEKTDFFEQEFS